VCVTCVRDVCVWRVCDVAWPQALDEVVEELLKVYPDGTHVKDKNGRYPVRIAFENAGSDGVMDKLLTTFAYAAQEKVRMT
jgi:hypothetical protein